MFKRHEYTLISNPYCSEVVKDLTADDFKYYDKDGFELNHAERKFYSAMKYPLGDCLNHVCWQEPWFSLEKSESLILDHSMFLCRCAYDEEALQQLRELSKTIPQASLLMNTKMKWGFDFALDAVENNQVYEVLHVEYDSRDYSTFCDKLLRFEYLVRHTDWNDAADKVWNQKHQWEGLTGFEQNHWKAKFLLGWNLAEYTEKSI